MSCNSDDSCCGRSAIGWLLLLLIGAFLVVNFPEIKRYIKISSM